MDAQGGVVVDRVEKVNCVGCQQMLDVSHLPSFSEFKCPHCDVSQRVPAQLGSFVLVERLGSGGMGVVYRAYDQKLGRFVALKVMKHLGRDEDFQQFCREAQATAQLNHPNVVQIYNFDQDQRLQPYIVMELVSEGRLDDKIAGGKQLDEEFTLKTHIDVANGLKAASEFGLIHGDVKPENILFGSHGEAKVVDFGLAKFLGEAQQQPDGTIMGTPYYVAPEKARGKKVDFRSDIYSLGATLFHVLAGRPPFEGATAVDVVLARLHNPAPDISQFRSDLHPATIALVARMLEAEPIMRYPSYAALLVDLEGALEETRFGEAKQQRPASIKVAKTMTMRVARRVPAQSILLGGPFLGFDGWKKWAVIGGAVVVVLGALGSGVFFYSEHVRKQNEIKIEKQTLIDAKIGGEELAQRINRLAQLVADTCTNALGIANRAEAMLQSVTDDDAQQALIEATKLSENILFGEAQAASAIFRANVAYKKLVDVKTAAEASALTNELTQIADSLLVPYVRAAEDLPLAGKKLADVGKIVQKAVEAERAIQKAINDENRKKADEARRLAQEEKDRKKNADAALKQAAQEEKDRAAILKESEDAELKKVVEERAKNERWVKIYRFDLAAKSMNALNPLLKTDKARDASRAARDAYEQMGKLVTFLIRAAGNSPIRGGFQLGNTQRDVIAINDKELTVSLGAPGSVATVEWKDVKIRDMGSLLASATRGIPEKERSELLLGFALLHYENADVKAAEKTLGIALKGDPSLRELAGRLMPGVGE